MSKVLADYTIALPPITKKNSQQILTNRQTNKPFVVPSKQYRDYEAKSGWFLKPRPRTAISTAVNVKCLYYMPTHRKCDLTNLEEATDDILVKYGILADDNYTVVAGHDGSRVYYDKDRPRTEITITEMDDNEK